MTVRTGTSDVYEGRDRSLVQPRTGASSTQPGRHHDRPLVPADDDAFDIAGQNTAVRLA